MKEPARIDVTQEGLMWSKRSRLQCSDGGDPATVVPLLLKTFLVAGGGWQAGRVSSLESYLSKIAPGMFVKVRKNKRPESLSYYYNLILDNADSKSKKKSQPKWYVYVYSTTTHMTDAHIIQWQLRHKSRYPDRDTVVGDDKGLALVNLDDFRSCLNHGCYSFVGLAEICTHSNGRPRIDLDSDLAGLLEDHIIEPEDDEWKDSDDPRDNWWKK